MHAAEVMHELKRMNNSLAFYGIGGDEMMKQGLTPLYHINRMAFLGFVEVVKHLPFILKVKRDVMELVREKQIKTAVLVDYPGFNLNLARMLKKAGVEIVYYISPQVWAWRSSRIQKIKKLVRKMLVVFPFEETLYCNAGVDAEFVGHPLMEQLGRYWYMPKSELWSRYKLNAEKEVLLVLPGSRTQEVEKIFPDIIEGACKAAEQHNLQVVVACAPLINTSFFREYIGKFPFTVVQEHVFDFMKYAKAGVIKSGTSTLQAGLSGLPMVIVYKTSPLTFAIGKRLVKIEHIGLANIVAGKTVVPELLQDELNTKSIVREISGILEPARYERIKEDLNALSRKLGDRKASYNSAVVINGVLSER